MSDRLNPCNKPERPFKVKDNFSDLLQWVRSNDGTPNSLDCVCCVFAHMYTCVWVVVVVLVWYVIESQKVTTLVLCS